jgi:hypothetical protein
LYPWDLHDEGVENVLDNLQHMAAVNSVYLIALMHKERRPFTSEQFPHNPVRKMWNAEDSRAYWRWDEKRYGRIKPRASEFEWLNRTDWLKQLVDAARRRGLKTGVEISHTVLDGERAETQFPDCMQRDISGAPLVIWDGRAHPVCLNNPDVRDYVRALYTDLAANYDLDYIQTCMIPFAEGDASKGGCFCQSCRAAAEPQGIAIAHDHAAWQKFREDSVARFYAAMHSASHSVNRAIDIRYNAFMRNTALWGLDLRLLRPHVDSVRIMEYSEQKGNPAAMQGKRTWLLQARDMLGGDMPILSAVAVRPKATPDLIRHGVRIAVECGVQGITLGHYDGAEFPMLRAIRDGLNEAQVLK